MKIFISGGCKNGKSFYAQHLAKKQHSGGGLYYVATMASTDGEDDRRIARHQADRDGWGFETVEQYYDIENILTICDHRGSFLLDSLTALLANEMFLPDGSINQDAAKIIADGLMRILNKVENIVIVSDYIYSDAFIYEPLTEKYRESLAFLDQLTAKCCDAVLEITSTQVVIHKGGGGTFDTIC
ncbi:MAG: bifunctional adenosylcobinamide kinase/adenosylcobinamide-phosphate guanylyltransferase [Firmicutes bacterium]|nr:bifunctional adenosylcobinamide kinase/adenosylcobinamide-phosphate guanylyltransferase [Bacillota bacterium]